MSSLEELGEQEVIRRLARLLPTRDDVAVHAGDDTAVVTTGDAGYDWLLTSDPVIEGVHFLPDTPARQIGHKAVGRVFSDIAAMGGEPLWVLIDLAADRQTDVGRVEEVFAGASSVAGQFGAAIVGGDTSEGTGFELHVFAVGRVPRGTAVLRSGARPGDALYVTGALGGSRSGKHLDFDPRLKEGAWLRGQGYPTAMIDITDGLATDVRHILEMSGVGADISASKIPVSEAARGLSDDRSPLEHALFDGEDFELLFTIPPAKTAEFEDAWENEFRLSCTRMGSIHSERDVLNLVDENGVSKALSASAYQHFRSQEC